MIDDIRTSLCLLEKLLRNLGPEASKFLLPASEGYKYEVKLVRQLMREDGSVMADVEHELSTREVCDLLDAERAKKALPEMSRAMSSDEAIDPHFFRPHSNPVPASPFFSDCGSCQPTRDPVEPLVPPPVIPYDPALKYEHKGLTCDVHGLQAHRRERDAGGPWTCIACAPEPPEETTP